MTICAVIPQINVKLVITHILTEQSIYVQRNIETLSCNNCCSGKSNKYCRMWVCLYSQASSMPCACPVLSFVACPAVRVFPHYLVNSTIKKVLNTKCVFFFLFSVQLLCEIFLTLRRTERHMIKNIYRLPCKVSAILVRF